MENLKPIPAAFMNFLIRPRLVFRAALALAGASPLVVAGNPPRANPFFAFDNGVGREAKWSPEQQADLLVRFGFAGIGYSGVTDLAARQAAFRAKGLKIFNLYVAVHVDRPVAYDPEITAVLPQLAGTGTALWLTVQGRSPNDERAVTLVRELADSASKHGVTIALYPHKGFFIATAEDALRILPRINRANVGLTINLCHELAAGHAERMDAIVQACAKHLLLVSINPRSTSRNPWPPGEGTRRARREPGRHEEALPAPAQRLWQRASPHAPRGLSRAHPACLQPMTPQTVQRTPGRLLRQALRFLSSVSAKASKAPLSPLT